MKMKTLLAALLATCWLQPAAFSQTNAAAADQTAVVADTNAPAAAPATGDSSGSATDTNAALPVVATIPLIQFQDVPLTTAIDALARQAGINYLLDPKIGFGQPDANGQVKAEPNLSIRWENIPAQHALEALLDNYGLQLVQDNKTKIYRVSVKDPTAPPPLVTRVVQLKYASTTNMMDSIQGTLTDKRSRVIPDTRTSQLIVVATDPEQAAVDTLVNQLDTPTKQVLIETRLVEISSDPTSSKGIDWSGTLAAQNVSFGNNVLGGQSGNPYSQTLAQQPLLGFSGGSIVTNGILNTVTYGPNNLLQSPGLLMDTLHGLNPTTAFLNADGAHAVLSFLNSSANAQVMSTPRIVTLDNETATIAVQQSIPILQTTAGTQGSPGGSSITYSNVGTTLLVTPRISANNTIRLSVTPTVANFDGYQNLTANGAVSQAPTFDSRTLTTQVLIPNANTLVMGGLVDNDPVDTATKVPILGDIPFLGAAFRSETKSASKKNLLVFITPTILQDADFHPTTTDFLNSKPEKIKDPLDPNSVWDSSKPHNWSDPQNTDPDQKILNQQSTL
jgi:type II secretory pathway component GspD/PulD (secretin)